MTKEIVDAFRRLAAAVNQFVARVRRAFVALGEALGRAVAGLRFALAAIRQPVLRRQATRAQMLHRQYRTKRGRRW